MVQLVQLDQMVPQEPPVLQGQADLPEHQDLLERADLQEHLVLLEHLDHQELLVLLEQADRQEHLVLQELQELTGLQELLV